MTFQELPDEWRDLPLTDPQLVADVLDLVVSDADRLAGCLAAVLCDEQARLCAVSIMTEPERLPSDADKCRAVGVLVEAIATSGGGSILFALARPDGLSITADDESWARAARQECTEDARLLGFHLITRDGSRQIPGTMNAA
jgi:hypothetical protein